MCTLKRYVTLSLLYHFSRPLAACFLSFVSLSLALFLSVYYAEGKVRKHLLVPSGQCALHVGMLDFLDTPLPSFTTAFVSLFQNQFLFVIPLYKVGVFSVLAKHMAML